MQFAAVEVATAASPSPEPPTPVASSSPAHADGLIEIVLPCGMSLRVDAHVGGGRCAGCWARSRADDRVGVRASDLPGCGVTDRRKGMTGRSWPRFHQLC